MFKLIVPIILVITSGLIGFFEISPLYEQVNTAKSEEQNINDALQKTKNIGDIAEELRSKVESISVSDINKLDVLLPENIDEIRFLNMLNSIAQRQGLALSQLNVTSDNGEVSVTEITTLAQTKILTASFSVFAPYETFKSFLNDLEKSLSLIDVDSIIISVPEYGVDTIATDSYTYSIKLSTYWIE